MLKLKLDSIEGLPAAIASEYKKEGDVYVLDTDVPFEDTKALKNALVQEKEHRKTATQKVTELETQITDLTARAGSVTDLEKSWKDKVAKVESDYKAKTDILTSQLRETLVDNVAQGLAAEVSTAPNLILPHIKSRLTIAEEDGKMITRVLTADGKASALGVNDLKSEIVADPQFAPIITGSKASGGGAQGGKTAATGGAKSFAEMSEGEKTTLFRSDRAKFDQLAAAAKAAPKAAPAAATV